MEMYSSRVGLRFMTNDALVVDPVNTDSLFALEMKVPVQGANEQTTW
jgi:hypothetical protein